MKRLTATTVAAAALVLGPPSAVNASPPATAEEAAAVFHDAVTDVLAENPWFEGTRVDSALCYESMVLLGGWHCIATLTGGYAVTGTVAADGGRLDTFEVYGSCGPLLGQQGDPCESSPTTAPATPAASGDPAPTFGDGRWLVGVDIQPGLYSLTTDAAEPFCAATVYNSPTEQSDIVLASVPGTHFVDVPADAHSVEFQNLGDGECVWTLDTTAEEG